MRAIASAYGSYWHEVRFSQGCMRNFCHANAAIREIELGRPRYIGYLVLGVGPFARWGDLGTSHWAAMGRTFLPTINPARSNRSADDDRIFLGKRVLLRVGHIGGGRWNAETPIVFLPR